MTPGGTDLSFALTAARRAASRLQQAGVSDEEVAAGTAECVMWIVALWDAAVDANGKTVTDASLANSGLRDVLWGLRYVRNEAVHQLVIVAEVADGRTYPRSYPSTYRTITWRSDAGLPAGRHADQRLAYDAAVAGASVPSLLEAALDWLDGELS